MITTVSFRLPILNLERIKGAILPTISSTSNRNSCSPSAKVGVRYSPSMPSPHSSPSVSLSNAHKNFAGSSDFQLKFTLDLLRVSGTFARLTVGAFVSKMKNALT